MRFADMPPPKDKRNEEGDEDQEHHTTAGHDAPDGRCVIPDQVNNTDCVKAALDV